MAVIHDKISMPVWFFCQFFLDFIRSFVIFFLIAGDVSKSAYVAVLLTFINCIIRLAEDAKKSRILADLKGCHFYDILPRIARDHSKIVRERVESLMETLEMCDEEDVRDTAGCLSVVAVLSCTPDIGQKKKLLNFLKNLETSTADEQNK